MSAFWAALQTLGIAGAVGSIFYGMTMVVVNRMLQKRDAQEMKIKAARQAQIDQVRQERQMLLSAAQQAKEVIAPIAALQLDAKQDAALTNALASYDATIEQLNAYLIAQTTKNTEE